MNILETKMLTLLNDLKENYNVVGVKAEFETEMLNTAELTILKELTLNTNLELTVKIGGSASIKDLYEAIEIGANNIVAPMIESPYAFTKFIETANSIFFEHKSNKPKLFINIETTNGFKYIEEILNNPLAKELTGIIMGRTDFIHSLNISETEINNSTILEYAIQLAAKTTQAKKEFIIGGGITPESIPFLTKLPINTLNKFETRKVIFDAPKALQNEHIKTGMLKAIDFELMWLKNKQNYNSYTNTDKTRISILEKRYNIV